MAVIAHFMGRRLSYIYEVSEMSDKKLVMKTAEGSFPMETTYEWENYGRQYNPNDIKNQGKPAGFSKIFSPFMSMMMRKANRKDLQRLKELLEKN